MKLTEVAMSPTKLKKSASKIKALVGLEIEGIFKFPDIDSSNIKIVNDIKSYNEFRTVFEEYSNKKQNNMACLTNFVFEEILEDEFNGDYDNADKDALEERVKKCIADAPLYWWEKYFQSFETVEDFVDRTYFSSIYGPDRTRRGVYTSQQFDNNDLSHKDKITELFHQLSQTEFGQYIREVVRDGSLSIGNAEFGYFTAEIITHPIKYSDIETFVRRFFTYLIEHFGFQTNESTGFHINVSIDGQTDIDFCKLMVFSGEVHELLKYSREDNYFTYSQISGIVQDPINEKNINYFIDAVNARIATTQKYRSFNINHWEDLHYIEFRIAGGTYSTKVPVILSSINRYVTIMDIATDSELYVKEYHKKVANLMSKQYGQHSSQLKLKSDNIVNAKSNIEQKIGYTMDDDDDIQNNLFRILMFSRNGTISLTPNEKIWLRQQAKKFGKAHFTI